MPFCEGWSASKDNLSGLYNVYYPYFFTVMTWWIVMETWKLTDFASENPRTVQTQMNSQNPGGLF